MKTDHRSTKFIPRARPWDSLALFSNLTRNDVALTDEELEPRLGLIDYAMITEFDAQNFDAYLTNMASKGVVFSPDFMAFRASWKWDEWNHYLGYRRLLHILTGTSEEQLHKRTIGRVYDFQPIADLLKDEFSICMVLAYDELVTRLSCTMAFGLFRTFGHENFLTWIRLVGRDEGLHLWNVLNVIRRCHRNRFSDIAILLERLIEWDLGRKPYFCTFVLDHDPDIFDETILRWCTATIANYLERKVE